GNGYDEGFVAAGWQPAWDYQREQTPETAAALRDFLSFEATKAQYVAGVPDESVVSPDTWHHDYALLSRPGNDAIQLKLFLDYASNPKIYPALHDYLRASAVPLLAVWGDKDPFFGPAGARAFADDAVDAEIHLLDGGHFLLESALADVTTLIRDFLSRRLAASA
ncbi:alpha/beta hydrolase, partial [Mycobacterium sp. ITM-2017-0098]